MGRRFSLKTCPFPKFCAASPPPSVAVLPFFPAAVGSLRRFLLEPLVHQIRLFSGAIEAAFPRSQYEGRAKCPSPPGPSIPPLSRDPPLPLLEFPFSNRNPPRAQGLVSHARGPPFSPYLAGGLDTLFSLAERSPMHPRGRSPFFFEGSLPSGLLPIARVPFKRDDPSPLCR